MSITVPAKLKARMDAVEGPPSWSAVASAAFEAELAAITARKGVENMSDVVSRLRASKRKTEDSRYQEGFAAGERWARERAEAEELERLQSLRDRIFMPDEWLAIWGSDRSSAFGPGEKFVSEITAEEYGLRERACEFWGREAGEDRETLMYDSSYVRGFAEGALEVWDAVKDQL